KSKMKGKRQTSRRYKRCLPRFDNSIIAAHSDCAVICGKTGDRASRDLSPDCHTNYLSLKPGEDMKWAGRGSVKKSKTRMQWLALVLAALAPASAQRAPAQLLINGAGATFPYPIYAKWFDEYSKVDPSVRFNYQSIGSGGGQRQIIEGTVDFGASDGPMSDQNLAKAPGKILHIPTVAGADVVTYNLPDNPVLKLDGPTIADIFLGRIM